MSVVFTKAQSIAADAVKTVLCSVGSAERVVQDILNSGSPYYRGTAGSALAKRAVGALTSFCPTPPPTDKYAPPAFTGGQCLGVTYLVQWSVIINASTTPIFGGRRRENFLGPLRGFNFVNSAWYFLHGGTDFFVYSDSDIKIVPESVVRLDGAADTCGDAPRIPSPTPPTNPFQPGTTVNVQISPSVTVPVIFTPIVGIVNVDVDGRLTVPVAVNVSYQGPSGNVNYDIDVGIDISNPTAPPVTPPSPFPRRPDGRPNPPSSPPLPPGVEICPPTTVPDVRPPNPPRPTPEPDPTEVLAGAILTTNVSLDARATEIEMAGSDSIYAPRLGNLRWQGNSSGVVVMAPDEPIKTLSQYSPVPRGEGVEYNRCIVTPISGVATTVQYVFVRK